jgi:hypothetical protein
MFHKIVSSYKELRLWDTRKNCEDVRSQPKDVENQKYFTTIVVKYLQSWPTVSVTERYSTLRHFNNNLAHLQYCLDGNRARRVHRLCLIKVEGPVSRLMGHSKE